MKKDGNVIYVNFRNEKHLKENTKIKNILKRIFYRIKSIFKSKKSSSNETKTKIKSL